MSADDLRTGSGDPLGRSIRPVDDDEWDVLDVTGNRIGLIWHSPDGWRCARASDQHLHHGISHHQFEVVLQHALTKL